MKKFAFLSFVCLLSLPALALDAKKEALLFKKISELESRVIRLEGTITKLKKKKNLKVVDYSEAFGQKSHMTRGPSAQDWEAWKRQCQCSIGKPWDVDKGWWKKLWESLTNTKKQLQKRNEYLQQLENE